MRKLLLTLLLLASLPTLAQRLTLNELVSFVKKDIVDINLILSEKNWVYLNSEKDNEDVIARWAYEFHESDSTAQAWIVVKTNPAYFNAVTYQCPTPQIFNEIIKGILSFKPQIGSAYRKDDGALEKTYYGASYWYKSSTISQTNSITISDKESQHKRDMEFLKPYIVNPDKPVKIELIYTTTLKEGRKQAVIYKDEEGTELMGVITSENKIQVYNRGDQYYWIKFGDSFGYINKDFLKTE